MELLQDIKQKDRRAKHFMKDKQTTLNLVCIVFIMLFSWHVILVVISSHDHWPNHLKIFENICEKLTKISMKWRRKPNLPVMFWLRRIEYLSNDVICNHPFEHEKCFLFIVYYSYARFQQYASSKNRELFVFFLLIFRCSQQQSVLDIHLLNAIVYRCFSLTYSSSCACLFFVVVVQSHVCVCF